MINKSFGNERARRFATALRLLPNSRIQELIPLLILVCQRSIRDAIVVDLASGTGFVSSLLDPYVKKVIRVDRSSEMLNQASDSGDVLTCELHEVHDKWTENLKPNLMISLAALHHICSINGDIVELEASRNKQEETLKSWIKLLAPGGRLVVVDVGIPDFSSIQNIDGQFSSRMIDYYQRNKKYLDNFRLESRFEFDEILNALFKKNSVSSYLQQTSFVQGNKPTLGQVLEIQMPPARFEKDHVVPIDFFNNVVANHSIDGHFANFLTEQEIKNIFEDAGLNNILVSFMPTPWIFSSELEALWFVRELFGIGKDHISTPNELIGDSDFQRLKIFVETFLGMWKNEQRVFVNWQLLFAYGEKK